MSSDLKHKRDDFMIKSELFYEQPIEIVRGEGVWLWDSHGSRYLDCYNNVASVGHCHHRVVEAITKQVKRLNTHTRYLHQNVIEFAEKLTGLMPDGLDVAMFTCTGTEANELAMRFARTVTGKNGIIVSKSAYHGNSTLVHELSTCKYDPTDVPSHVATITAPNPYRTEGDLSGEVDTAIAALEGRGEGAAALLVDTIYDAEGVYLAPGSYLKSVADKIRAAGGLLVADEVQAGICRTGKWWGFEHGGLTPDIVTLGKPLGCGHPVAAVVTSKEIAEEFTKKVKYFNTFGGNPVSAAVGNEVLKICDEMGYAEHVKNVGQYLEERLTPLMDTYDFIGDIRGAGLFWGIELVKDRTTKEPDAERTNRVPDLMKDRGVLMGITGAHDNVLKIRPPLVFDRENVDQLMVVLQQVLDEIA